MKILFDVDQNASIANGHEADNSTEFMDVPVNRVNNKLREKLAGHWDPATKVVSVNGRRPAPLVKPYNLDDAIAVLRDLFSNEFDPAKPVAAKSIP